MFMDSAIADASATLDSTQPDPVSPDPQFVWSRAEQRWHYYDNDGQLALKISREGIVVERFRDLSGRVLPLAP
jgi:hypothetical protein